MFKSTSNTCKFNRMEPYEPETQAMFEILNPMKGKCISPPILLITSSYIADVVGNWIN